MDTTRYPLVPTTNTKPINHKRERTEKEEEKERRKKKKKKKISIKQKIQQETTTPTSILCLTESKVMWFLRSGKSE